MSLKMQDWLVRSHPGLKADRNSVTGILEFKGAYNETTGRFVIIKDGKYYEDPGLVLSGAFNINIEGSIQKAATQLPTLYVEDVNHEPDRHFN